MIWINSLLGLISLLTLLKAPAKPLWYVAIGATEWGHYLAMLSVLLAFIAWWVARCWTPACWVAGLAACLFCTPYVRATQVAYDLPAELTKAFGSATPRGSSFVPIPDAPLSLIGLFLSISSPDVAVSQREYARINGQALLMDVYRAHRSTAPMPGVVIIHGGSWKGGDRAELVGFNRYLAARGYLVVSIDYRLAPQSIFPAQREDVWTAIGYLKEHAKELGMDPGRMVLVGRSAGGQLALSAAYGRKDPAVKGVVAYYTPSDLVWGYENPTNPLVMNSCKTLETYLGGPLRQIRPQYEAASPVFQVNSNTPPTLMIQGLRDELVSPEHNNRLVKRLNTVGQLNFQLKMPWATHGCDANLNGPCGQLSTYAVERFLAAVIPGVKQRTN